MRLPFDHPHLDPALSACVNLERTVLFVGLDLIVVGQLLASKREKLAVEPELGKHVLYRPVDLHELGSFTSHWAGTVVALPLLDAGLAERPVAVGAFNRGISDNA